MDNEMIKALRLLLGIPALSIMVIMSGNALTKNGYAPWEPAAFFAGLGLAIIIKGIELLVHHYQKE